MAVPILTVLAIVGFVGFLVQFAPPISTRFNRYMFSVYPTMLPTPTDLIVAYFRGIIDKKDLYQYMKEHGYSKEMTDVILGTSYFYPTPSDLVSWQAREVYEPKAIEKYGLDAEFEELKLEEFFKAGMTEEQIKNFWRAHWTHPPFTQVVEMFRRDILTSPEDRRKVKPGTAEWKAIRKKGFDLFYEWFRLVEIPPYWRERLIELTYEPYTRVDIRRMEDLGVVDDDTLFRNYLDLGYDEEKARQLVIWTKQYVRLPDLMAQLRNGWITPEEFKARLIELGVKENVAEEILKTRVKKDIKPQRLQKERDLTKSEIIKGFRKGIIDEKQTIDMLMRLGYDEDEAAFLLALEIAAMGSPETPLEIRGLIEKYRRSAGMEYKEIPEVVLKAEREFIKIKKERDEAIKKGLPQDEIDRLNTKLADAEYRYIQLLKAYKII